MHSLYVPYPMSMMKYNFEYIIQCTMTYARNIYVFQKIYL